MGNSKKVFLWLFLFFFMSGCQSSAFTFWGNGSTYPDAAGYGEKVRFAQGRPIRFPDFTLTYLGERHEPSDKFPHGFDYHDFQVGRAVEGFTVFWSSGTGVVDPTLFEMAGQTYRLELVYSDELGNLADNEVVIAVE